MKKMIFSFAKPNKERRGPIEVKVIDINFNVQYEIIFTPVDWDDYGFTTIFEVRATKILNKSTSEIESVNIGSVKIGYLGQKAFSWTADNEEIKGKELNKISENFFTMGVDNLYYENINNFFDYNWISIERYYVAIRDIAYNNEILSAVENERVFTASFLRSTSYENITNQYSALVKKYKKNEIDMLFDENSKNFTGVSNKNKIIKARFRMGISVFLDDSKLDFYINKNDYFKNNIYALIGSNGSGKSKLLDKIIGDYLSDKMEVNDLKNIVLVSFSPFDKLTSYKKYKINKINNRKSIRFIGLKDEIDPDKYTDFDSDFFESLGNCLISESKREKLRNIIVNLYSDPILKKSNIIDFVNNFKSVDNIIYDYNFIKKDIIYYFNMLSSGHKVVLYTTIKLVDLVDLNTLVLFDEPELYLHPPLLSSFIRSISDILNQNNAMAIVTTHSPIVLQEIPKNYIKVIRNINGEIIYGDIKINTLGERVDIITNEIFNLEIYESGYYKLILDFFENNKGSILNINDGYRLFESYFNVELGSEAKKVIISIINNYLNNKRN